MSEPSTQRDPTKTAIRACELSKDYGQREVLRGVDLAIGQAESVLLRGSNGAGKTTLLRCLAGAVRPTAGQVWWQGNRVTRGDASLRRLVGVVAHESRLYPQLTLQENLLFAARMFGMDQPGERAKGMLRAYGLAEHAHRFPGQVSRGMRQRASLARAMVHQPPILLLDEPFSGLDAGGRRWLRKHLAELRDQGRTVCLASHQEEEVESFVDRILELQSGVLVEKHRATGRCAA